MLNDIDEIRNIVKSSMKPGHYKTAIFWSEILLNTDNSKFNWNCQRKRHMKSLSGKQPSDLLNFIEALYHNEEYRRSIYFIDKYQLSQKFLTFRLLSARCYFAMKDCTSAISALDCGLNCSRVIMSTSVSGIFENMIQISGYHSQEALLFNKTFKELENSCYLLLGEIFEYMENRESAVEYYKMAVRTDVKCYAAIERLHSGNMLTNEEARQFLASLDYSSAGSETVAQMIRTSYVDLFRVECAVGDEDKLLTGLNNENHSSLLNKANRYYNNSRFKKAYELTKKILSDDPNNPHCVILHAAILTELKYTNELFSFASSLFTDNVLDKKESWYSIGCYYLSRNQYGLARQQFLKATEIDKFFGEAWLAVGHTYSSDNNQDKALAAYSSASQVMKGSHLPVLYIALEYSLSNNSSVSINYLQEAMQLGSHDPHCWHEKGFISFNNKNYQEALQFFLRAYDMQRAFSRDNDSVSELWWEPLLNNIGHTYRKMGHYDQALQFFSRALSKRPRHPSLISSMALVHAQKGDILRGVSCLETLSNLSHDAGFAQLLMATLVKINSKYNNNQSMVPESDNQKTNGKDNFKIPRGVVLNNKNSFSVNQLMKYL